MILHVIIRTSSFFVFGTGNKIITEGEYVEINGITKDMSGSYECVTSNDISPPDIRTVQVTVNCEYYVLHFSV